MKHPLHLPLLLLALAGLACQTLAPTPTPRPSATPLPPPTQAAPPTDTPAPTASGPVFNEDGVRLCDYIPGQSVPAVMPPEVQNPPTPTPYTPPPLPPNATVSAEVRQRQLRVYRELWNAVNDNYVYRDFNGRDWRAIGDKYEALIRAGLTDDDFYYAMQLMINELGDEHSQYQSPAQVLEEDAALAGNNDYVGVGVLLSAVPDANYAVIILTFENGPARAAGLRSHDRILLVNGEPILDEEGALQSGKVRGPEGTQVTLTVQRPGGEPYDLTLTRRRITGRLPIDYCLVPNTRIGYIMLPGLDDETIPQQVREALTAMTQSGPLDGLVLDNRQNGGGSSSVLNPLMTLFVDGKVGDFVSPDATRPFTVRGRDLAGSQSVPLVVLVDVDTVSFGEIMSGVLQNTGRATVIGGVTLGNVETLWGYDFSDGSRAWIARETFQPTGQPLGIWEEQGVVPDILLPTRWDLFTEATDPALAEAVRVLLNR